MSKSRTACTLSIVSSLDAAKDILGKDAVWNPISEYQKEFLNVFVTPELICACRELLADIISAVASDDSTVINNFLAERGFNIQIEPLGPLQFATASVLDQIVKWCKEGTKTTISRENDPHKYNAVSFSSGDW